LALNIKKLRALTIVAPVGFVLVLEVVSLLVLLVARSTGRWWMCGVSPALQ
jgi:hypothetical protein